MTPEQIQQTMEALQAVGGTIWSAYYRQAVLFGIGNLTVAVMFFMIIGKVKNNIERIIREEADSRADESFGISVLWFIVGIFLFLDALIFFSGLWRIINPDYYAILNVIDTLKGVVR